MDIGSRIKLYREQRNMSQQELAEAVGYKTASAINKIETGIRDINQSQIVAFADALNVSPSVLMGWETDEFREKMHEEQKVLFDLSSKATPEQMSQIIKMVKIITGDDE